MKLKTYPKRIINQSVQGTYLNGYYNSVNYTLTFDDYKATGLKEIECTLERVEISPLTQKQTNSNKYVVELTREEITYYIQPGYLDVLYNALNMEYQKRLNMVRDKTVQ